MLGTQEQRTKELKKQAQESIEHNYDRGFKAGYEKGFKNGFDEGVLHPDINIIEKWIKQGRNEAWEAADKLNRLHLDEVMEVFADDPLRDSICREDLFRCCTPELAIEKIKEYEKKKQEEEKADDEILVGDEVYTEDKEIKYVVTRISEESAHLVDCKGNFAWKKTYCLHKTGRNFHEIENVLGQLKEVE